jgi:hypothetical protein
MAKYPRTLSSSLLVLAPDGGGQLTLYTLYPCNIKDAEWPTGKDDWTPLSLTHTYTCVSIKYVAKGMPL